MWVNFEVVGGNCFYGLNSFGNCINIGISVIGKVVVKIWYYGKIFVVGFVFGDYYVGVGGVLFCFSVMEVEVESSDDEDF